MRPWTTTPARHAARRRTAALALLTVSLAASACGSGGSDAAPAPSGSSTTSTASTASSASGTASAGSATERATTAAGGASRTTPPPGSGATAPGVTPTTPAPLQPSGSTRTAVACRQLYPVVTTPISAFNAANSSGDSAALTQAAADMAKAADAIPAAVKDSGDEKLVTLSTSVVDQLKAVVTAVGSNGDVDGGPLNAATAALWAHCQSAQ